MERTRRDPSIGNNEMRLQWQWDELYDLLASYSSQSVHDHSHNRSGVLHTAIQSSRLRTTKGQDHWQLRSDTLSFPVDGPTALSHFSQQNASKRKMEWLYPQAVTKLIAHPTL